MRAWLTLVPLFLFLCEQDASACRCREPSLRQAYSNADVVAVVYVEAVAPGEIMRAHVKVERTWKSSLPEHADIVTGEDCSYSLIEGQRYLLYLKRGDGDDLGTYQCRGNKTLAKAAASVRWLNRNAKPQLPR